MLIQDAIFPEIKEEKEVKDVQTALFDDNEENKKESEEKESTPRKGGRPKKN